MNNSPFQSISTPIREDKPRNSGVTMVIDKNLSPLSLKNLLVMAGDYIDIVKFAWGTTRIISKSIIDEKISLLKDSNVLVGPGGTLFELAFSQNKVDEFLLESKNLGFSYIEISDGTVSIPHQTKLKMIKKAKESGFTVFSEIGKKNRLTDKRYSIEERIDNALLEIKEGASKIIIEGRESGTVGVFDESGEIIPDFVEKLTNQIRVDDIIFEAPRVSQQEWFINNLGSSVNLGNIYPEDCINLETLRCGLRSGTMKQYHVDKTAIFIENGVSGALRAANRNDIIIVIDALRFTSTVVSAIANGITTIKPVTSAEECIGEITAGERGGAKIPSLDFDNSPITFQDKKFKGKNLTITATNGTECINASNSKNSLVLVGSMLNAKAVSEKALELAHQNKKNISLVMAGRINKLAKEDLIVASEIVMNLPNSVVKGNIVPIFSENHKKDFEESESGRNLISLGRFDDVMFCAEKDIFNVVPILKNGLITLE